MDDSRFLREQIRERLSYYRSLSEVGFRRPAGADAAVEPPAPRDAERESLEAIRARLGECTRCRLHAGRRSLVFGSGNPDADLMFIGEGPGFHEDRLKRPFVGRAGQRSDGRVAEHLVDDGEDGANDSALLLSQLYFSELAVAPGISLLGDAAPSDVGLSTGQAQDARRATTQPSNGAFTANVCGVAADPKQP